MTSKVFTPRFSVIITAILLGALMRLVPHWPNFTPVAAIALFGGAYISRKYLAFIIPIAAMLISDLFLGFHPYLLPVYGCFAVSVLLGIIIRKNTGFFTVVGASLLSSVIFYLVTNFAMWVGNPNFTQDFQGLLQCYTVAIPFFNNGVLGDLFYNGILFGGFYLAGKYIPALQKA
jgi:hypothetical protein